MEQMSAKHQYWRANLRLVAGCLTVWFIVSFGFGILLAEPLNRIPFFGFGLGFWFAQQGPCDARRCTEWSMGMC